jgi:hypothetical protein
VRIVWFLTALALMLGLCLLVAIGFAALRSPGSPSSRARRFLGWALIAVPLPLATALNLVLATGSTLDQIALVVGVFAFGAGALLVLQRDDEGEEQDTTDNSDPPSWWPEFEREFHTYSQLTGTRK